MSTKIYKKIFGCPKSAVRGGKTSFFHRGIRKKYCVRSQIFRYGSPEDLSKGQKGLWLQTLTHPLFLCFSSSSLQRLHFAAKNGVHGIRTYINRVLLDFLFITLISIIRDMNDLKKILQLENVLYLVTTYKTILICSFYASKIDFH